MWSKYSELWVFTKYNQNVQNDVYHGWYFEKYYSFKKVVRSKEWIIIMYIAWIKDVSWLIFPSINMKIKLLFSSQREVFCLLYHSPFPHLLLYLQPLLFLAQYRPLSLNEISLIVINSKFCFQIKLSIFYSCTKNILQHLTPSNELNHA